jgi:hypothetical protein
MPRMRIPCKNRFRAPTATCLAALLGMALAGCGNDPHGGVQSAPTKVTAVSPAPPPAPVAPAPPAAPPDYAGTPCATLPAIQDPPTLIGKPASDPAYEAIKASGKDAVPCLVMALADTRPLDHPQTLPGTKLDFTIGDLAFFLLVDLGQVDFMRALPPDVAARVPARGAFAYFDWIIAPGNRERLQARVREQLRPAEVATARQVAPEQR